MAENSEKREGYPDRKTAEAMLAEAEKIDPGPWGNHFRVAAYAAEKNRFILRHDRDLDIYIGRIDIPESEALEVRRLLEEAEYDDYDRLIQLCDALAGSEGIPDVEERMADVKRRYGNYPQAQWDKNLELLGYFSEKAGENVYALLRRRDR